MFRNDKINITKMTKFKILFSLLFLSKLSLAENNSWWSWSWKIAEFRNITLPPEGAEIDTRAGEDIFATDENTAKPGEFPWQVSLQKGPGRHFCGGSIIDATHIITAAHCLISRQPWDVLVVAGAHNMKDPNESSQQRIWAARLIINPKYSAWIKYNHDSAIIELLPSTPLIFNDRVQPIKLAPRRHVPFGICTTTGWGSANPFGIGPALIPNTLKKTRTILVPRNICRIPYLAVTRSWIAESMVCGTNELFRGVCRGDSGGPLVCSDSLEEKGPYYLAGVTSFGVQPCGNPLVPSVFANVASQRDFIDGAVGYDVDINFTEAPVIDNTTDVPIAQNITDIPASPNTTKISDPTNTTDIQETIVNATEVLKVTNSTRNNNKGFLHSSLVSALSTFLPGRFRWYNIF